MSSSNETPLVGSIQGKSEKEVRELLGPIHTRYTTKTYLINEVFYSLQGEGVRAGTPNFFVRFSGCNLKCDVEPGPLSIGGFACDTEFSSGVRMTSQEIFDYCKKLNKDCWNVIFTGGEPLLQLDIELLTRFKVGDFYTCVETNGTIEPVQFIRDHLDWITLSPKVAEHAVKLVKCDEIKYVRAAGQGIPVPKATADYYLLSPAFPITLECLEWCIKLVKENPEWRLSVQQHKLWNIR